MLLQGGIQPWRRNQLGWKREKEYRQKEKLKEAEAESEEMVSLKKETSVKIKKLTADVERLKASLEWP